MGPRRRHRRRRRLRRQPGQRQARRSQGLVFSRGMFRCSFYCSLSRLGFVVLGRVVGELVGPPCVRDLAVHEPAVHEPGVCMWYLRLVFVYLAVPGTGVKNMCTLHHYTSARYHIIYAVPATGVMNASLTHALFATRSHTGQCDHIQTPGSWTAGSWSARSRTQGGGPSGDCADAPVGVGDDQGSGRRHKHTV